eukprot:1741095-Pyramimonas_sp.AAC.1
MNIRGADASHLLELAKGAALLFQARGHRAPPFPSPPDVATGSGSQPYSNGACAQRTRPGSPA